jgi:hypothetical protein
MNSDFETTRCIQEQEEYMFQNLDSFRDMILQNIEESQAVVLSARPSPDVVDESTYEEQM